MKTLFQTLAEFSQESAAQDEDRVTVTEVVADELAVAHDDKVVDKIEHAEEADRLADQLEELAERARKVAEQDKAYASEESCEALHREFSAIMTATGIGIRASSFESEFHPARRTQALVKDAERVSALIRSQGVQSLDYSPEGAIMQFLRRDQSRLSKARVALKGAVVEYDAIKNHEGDDKPIVIRNAGVARLLTQKGKPVTDLPKAIADDIEWIKKSRDRVESTVNKLAAAVRSGEGNIPSFDVAEIDTGKGALLGNRTVNDGKYGTEHKFSFKKAAVGAFLGAITYDAIYFTVAVGLFAIGAGAIANTAGRVAGLAAGVALGKGYYDARTNLSTTKSISTAEQLKKSAEDLLAMSADISGKFILPDGLDDAIDKLDSGARKKAKETLKELAKAYDAIYEHSIWLVVNMATLLEEIHKKVK